MTHTRIQALAFADYLAARKAWEEGKAQYPVPPVLTIGPLELLELSEAAQARADLVKAIAAETAAIEDECNAAGYDEHCAWHDPQLDGLRMDMDYVRKRGLELAALKAQQLPILDRAKRVLITSSVVLIGFLALIWAVAHFAREAGLPW
jgi:hypothetical protein